MARSETTVHAMRYLIGLVCFLGWAARLTAQTNVPTGFEAILDAVDQAQIQLQNGDAAAFKTLWSRADDVTLAGGFGGPVSKGWPPEVG